MTRVLVLGASGFIGASVARALDATPGVRTIRGHRGQFPPDAGPVIDIRDPDNLQDLQRADVVVHAAHAVSGDEATLKETNVAGSQHVAAACQDTRARLVAISTASVYGPGPWRGEDVQALRLAPESTVSASRARGDQAVLDMGGLVFRPHLVHGAADRWFVPQARALVGLTGWIDAGRSRHSTIHVDTLAAQVVAAALSPTISGVRLATDPPRTLPEVLAPYLQDGDVREEGSTYAQALRHTAGAAASRLQHHVHMMATDHYLSDSLDHDEVGRVTRQFPHGLT